MLVQGGGGSIKVYEDCTEMFPQAEPDRSPDNALQASPCVTVVQASVVDVNMKWRTCAAARQFSGIAVKWPSC